MRTLIILPVLFCIIFQMYAEVQIPLKAGNYDWMRAIRGEHPRLMFNRETFPAVRKRALGAEKETFQYLKGQVDALPDVPEMEWDRKKLDYGKDGRLGFIAPSYMLERCMPNVGGVQAAQSAFLYLMTGEERYLTKARNWLKHSLTVYEWALENQLMVEWEIRHYLATCFAYDWLYNDLSPEERRKILSSLYRITRGIQSDNRDVGQIAVYRRNRSGYKSGFYSNAALRWYAGLVGFGDGIEDGTAVILLKLGFDDFIKMMNYRDEIGGEDGSLVSACLLYCFTSYPYSTFNFLLSLRSATGIDGSRQWRQMRNFPKYVFWNMIPNVSGKRPLEFGVGDALHLDNIMPDYAMGVILPLCKEFYGRDDPAVAAYSNAVLNHISPNIRRAARRRNPIKMFLLTHLPEREESIPVPEENFCYIPNIGLAFMRSGNSPDSTFAVMRAGGVIDMHQHYDEGHFSIYKKGFVALDSGTRAIVHNYNLMFYYSQTVAHNVMLIHMPEEPIAPYWGEHHRGKYPGPQPFMHGGQYKRKAAKTVTASNKYFSYVKNDATASYRPEKCKFAVREFLHLQPDVFLVIDRVGAVKKEYRKEWLLHFQNEPEVSGDRFTAVEGGGRLTGKVLFPELFKIAKVGGPGKEFFASGQNWELHPVYEKKFIGKLHGNWRIEISPMLARNSDLFVNLLQVEDQANPQLFPEVRKQFVNSRLILEFFYAGGDWRIVIPDDHTLPVSVQISSKGKILCKQILK